MPDQTTTEGQNGEKAKEGFTGPRAILRVPDVLMALSRDRAGQSFAGLCETVDLPKSSLHRMLRTLESGGYVTNSRGIYQLGPEALRLARMMEQAAPLQGLPGIARPILQDMARDSGESVILAVLDESEFNVFYLDVVNSTARLRLMIPQGNVRPLHSASSGKAILAYLPDAALNRYLAESPFELFTPETTTREQLPEVLALARRRGVAFDRNGSLAGATGIAVPCFDAAGLVCCALSIAGPTDRFERSLSNIEAIALAGGEQISRALGYIGPYPRISS